MEDTFNFLGHYYLGGTYAGLMGIGLDLTKNPDLDPESLSNLTKIAYMGKEYDVVRVMTPNGEGFKERYREILVNK